MNTSAYHRILARLLRSQRAAASADSLLGMDYRADDPDYWMCPLNERDRAPLLGPGSSEATAGEMKLASWAAVDAAKAEKTWRHGFLPMTVDQYLELLDLTGRRLVEGKSGAIDEQLAPILERLGLRPTTWMAMVTEFENWFHGAVGAVDRIREHGRVALSKLCATASGSAIRGGSFQFAGWATTKKLSRPILTCCESSPDGKRFNRVDQNLAI